MLNELRTSPGPALPVGQLKPLLRKAATVSRWRRFAVLAGCVSVPTLLTALFFAVLFGNEKWLQEHPDVLPLRHCLKRLAALEKGNLSADEDRQREREALRIYIAGHFRRTISDLESRGFVSRSLFGKEKPYQLTQFAIARITKITGVSESWEPRLIPKVDLILYMGALSLGVLSYL